MYNFPIGFICGLKTAQLDLAAELKLNGVQLYMPVNGKAPRDMKGAKLAESRAMLSDRNLVVSALCGDMGAYDNPETNPGRVDEFKRIVDIAADFDTKVVTTHIGKVPSDRNNPTYDCMLKACDEIGTYAYRAGVRFAVETGPETAKVLCGFLDELDNPGAGVNLDPANLVMCSLDDPVQAVHTLKKYIVHTHAKDGRNITPPTETERPTYIELPLGEGGVDFPAYLKALDEIGYKGFLTIEREIEDNTADIHKAAAFLRGLIG